MKNKVENLLIELGIYPNLLGFDYICKAVGYISQDIKIRMGEVYNLVANESGTTPTAIERSIRHALSKADKDSEAYKKYLGIKDTSNSAILYTLSVRLREDCQDE